MIPTHYRRKFGWEHFEARVAAVEDARRAAQERRPLARTRTAQALVDLAFACEQLASPMPGPTVRLSAREPQLADNDIAA